MDRSSLATALVASVADPKALRSGRPGAREATGRRAGLELELSGNCSGSSPIQVTNGYHRSPGRALPRSLKAQILEFDRMIIAWHRSNETSKRRTDAGNVIKPKRPARRWE
jgi:hypothetical protein